MENYCDFKGHDTRCQYVVDLTTCYSLSDMKDTDTTQVGSADILIPNWLDNLLSTSRTQVENNILCIRDTPTEPALLQVAGATCQVVLMRHPPPSCGRLHLQILVLGVIHVPPPPHTQSCSVSWANLSQQYVKKNNQSSPPQMLPEHVVLLPP